MDVQQIYSQLKGKITKEEFQQKIKEKVDEFNGLLSEEGAAIMVAADLEVDLQIKNPQKSFHVKHESKNIRYCPFCGTTLKPDSTFCPNCGKKVKPSPISKTQKSLLTEFIEKILEFFSFGKKDKIRKFDELFYSNKWDEAIIYYNFLSTKKVPPEINERIELIRKNLKFPALVFLDIEFDPAVDEIWEIAAVKMRGSVRLGRFHSFVKSSSKVPYERLFHSELNAFKRALPVEKVIESFKSFLGGQQPILVGHNIVFDIEKLAPHFKMIVAHPSLDTLPLSYICWPLDYSHTLSDLMEVKETHRANDDVETNILLFNKIITEIESVTSLEKSLVLTLLDKTTAEYLKLYLGDVPPFDFSSLKKATEILISKYKKTHFSDILYETKINLSDKIAAKKNIFITIEGYLPREEYYKNLLLLHDPIIIPLPTNIFNERRYISEVTGEKEPSIYVSLSSETLKKFCFYKFWEILPSDLASLNLSYRNALLYLILWAIKTKDGIIDPNLLYRIFQSCPDSEVLLQKSLYSNTCLPDCPLKDTLCPTIHPRTHPDMILTDFSTAINLKDHKISINEAHNLYEYLTAGVTTKISGKDFDALQNELSGDIDCTSLENTLKKMEKALVDFVEKRDLIQQKKFTKKLRILESFQKSKDWNTLHKIKNSLIEEIHKIAEVDKKYSQSLKKVCTDLSDMLPEDFEETEYVTWISIYYNENTVENWSIQKTLIDITPIKEKLLKENCVTLISDVSVKSTFILDYLDLKDNIEVVTLSGVTGTNHPILAGHLPRPTRFNVLSFLSNFGELIYTLLETVPLEIISPSYMNTKVLSEFLRQNEHIKVVSHPLFESRRKMLTYTQRILQEKNFNFVFIEYIRNMRKKDIIFKTMLIERVPFPSFFDPVTSARFSRLITSAKDYEKIVVPKIAVNLGEIITYAQAASQSAVITDSRFSTGYYADTVNSMISQDFHVCKHEHQFFFTLEKILSKKYDRNVTRLHAISNRLEKILAKEGLISEIDLSIIDPLPYLRTFFGFSEFRPIQREVIESIFSGNDVFAVMPTGYGKSLCYQIPAIAFSILVEGLTVIISPLQALMRDQVQNLHTNGIIRATYINSSLSSQERYDRLKGVQNGWYDIVYISPEQLRNKKTRTALGSRDISFFVIDEAHCLSQWGHDFRPDYFYIPQFIETLHKRPKIAAFTATATHDVIDEVRKALKIKSSPFNSQVTRENLCLRVKKIHAENTLAAENIKQKILLEYISSQKGKNGIIYCTYTRTTEDLCYFLKKNSRSLGRIPDEIEYFHGKMDTPRKTRVQDGFMGTEKSQITLIAATNAFGMGIDKEDIHFIIHYDIPGSIELFYQEIGRAGRDESIQGECLLLYWKGDLEKQRKLINMVTEKDLIVIHENIKHYGPDEPMIYVSEVDLANDTGMNPTAVRVAISQLEKNKYVKRGTNAWRTMRLRLAALPKKVTSDQKKVISALQLNTGWKTIHIDTAASKLGWTVEKIEDELQALLMSNPPILQKMKEVQGTISDQPENNLNSMYELQKKLLQYFMNRSHDFEAGQWTSIYSKQWGAIAHKMSSYFNADVTPTMCREIMRYWQNQNLISLDEGVSKTSLILRHTPQKIFTILEEKKEMDVSLLKELILYSEHGEFSFDICDVSRKIRVHHFDMRDSLLRLLNFKVISLQRMQNTGNCMTIELISPHLHVNPFDIVLKPKDLNLKDLQRLQLEKETKIRIIQKYAEKTRSSQERWKFLEGYFCGDITMEPPKLQDIIKDLNERQVEVVTSPPGYVLVNAGAGTGKTLTVARRMLYITEVLGVPSSHILALTFSRSGVKQLRAKVKKVMPARRIDVRTYHSLAYQVLLNHVGEPPLWITPGFEVQSIGNLIYNFKFMIDNFEDGLPSREKIKLYQSAIEKLQSEREPVFPDNIKETDEITIEKSIIKGIHLKKLYSAYCNYLKSNNIIDFGFMLSQIVNLFKSRPETLQYYQRRIDYIIVDEYQDTTPVQDELLRLLADWYGNLTAVGDNDQNIFAWSFADVHNILNFDKRYPDTRIITLEKNYRSTKEILDVSNESITNNKMRIPKNLYPHRKDAGKRVEVHYTESKDDIGSDYIIQKIKRIQEKNICELNEIAVLTKSGAQQTTILNGLQNAGIPATSPKKEINILQSSVMTRILNVMEKICEETPDITAYSCYAEAVHALEKESTMGIADFVREFENSAEDNSAVAFIQYARSVSKSDFRLKGDKAVNVLTIHKSKGLEFKVVFVTHLRKHSFPMWKGNTEEERRVFYVALTRAMNALYLISSKEKSEFINEINYLLVHSEIIRDNKVEEV
ncbi:MAG: RecQ family ATP-dependent DNA helicase [Candidatus Methanofastidiosia archaeon]|jgi:RecQ family ATP-dependent DNA helicase